MLICSKFEVASCEWLAEESQCLCTLIPCTLMEDSPKSRARSPSVAACTGTAHQSSVTLSYLVTSSIVSVSMSINVLMDRGTGRLCVRRRDDVQIFGDSLLGCVAEDGKLP